MDTIVKKRQQYLYRDTHPQCKYCEYCKKYTENKYYWRASFTCILKDKFFDYDTYILPPRFYIKIKAIFCDFYIPKTDDLSNS